MFIGTFSDAQVRGVYSKHGDWAMDTLLEMTIKPIKEHTGLKLIPTYSYTRLYETGSKLARHKDRESCEISGTLNLGGDLWPIYIDPTGENNIIQTLKEVDGETMQHILKETGMEWQMLRQLIMTLPLEQVEYLIEERKDLGI